MWYSKETDSKTILMAISLCFGIFKNFEKKEVIREGHEASTKVEGALTLTGRAPMSHRHLGCLPDSVFLHVTYFGR